jgi:hypothetical protein
MQKRTGGAPDEKVEAARAQYGRAVDRWITVAVVAAVIVKPQDSSLHLACVQYVLTRGGMLLSVTLLYAWFTRGRE